MLVLTRKKNEKIFIGGGIVLTVVEIRGDKVRLGVTAPQEVPVHREEVWASIERARVVEPAEARSDESGETMNRGDEHAR